jgi:hypothetical protein
MCGRQFSSGGCDFTLKLCPQSSKRRSVLIWRDASRICLPGRATTPNTSKTLKRNHNLYHRYKKCNQDKIVNKL